MKIISTLFVFILSTVSFSQNIGVNGLYSMYSNNPDGLAFNVEYENNISTNLEYLFNASFFYHDYDSATNDFINIPIGAGLRYYFLRDAISPYISAEGNISYFSNTEFGSSNISESGEIVETYTYESATYSKIIFGFGLSIGTKITLSSKLNLNLGGKFGAFNENSANYFSYFIGLYYNL